MTRSLTTWIACSLVCAAPVAAQVSADPWFRAGTFMITVEAGGAAFTDFERSQARPVSESVALGDFRRRVSAQTSGSAGAWASYWLLNGVGLRAGLAYVPSGFTVWNDETAQEALGSDRESAAPRYASLDIWLASAAAILKFPRSFGRVAPYALIGGGVIRYNTSGEDSVPPEASEAFRDGSRQQAAALVGVGAAIPLQRNNLLLSFELTNHISRSPLGGSSGAVFELSGVDMQIDSDPALRRSDAVDTTSHLRLSLGLTLPLR
jgi:hypothetical protein